MSNPATTEVNNSLHWEGGCTETEHRVHRVITERQQCWRDLVTDRANCVAGDAGSCNTIRNCRACMNRAVRLRAARIVVAEPTHLMVVHAQDAWRTRAVFQRLASQYLPGLRTLWTLENAFDLHWNVWLWGLDRPEHVVVHLATRAGFGRVYLEMTRTPMNAYSLDVPALSAASYPLKDFIAEVGDGGPLTEPQRQALELNRGRLNAQARGFYRIGQAQVASPSSLGVARMGLRAMLDPEGARVAVARRIREAGAR